MKISVITTAYNHHDTLQRAIDSVSMQKCVGIEHIIIDDTLTNNGMMNTFHAAFKRCTGDYICFCDGDDYYIDDRKLLRQSSYMERHKDCAVCVTRAYTEINGIRNSVNVTTDYINDNMTFDNLLKGKGNIYAQTLMIRKSDFDKYIDFAKFLKFNVWDFPIVLELINHKRIHCLDFYSAVFTINTESVTHTRNRINRIKYKAGTYRIILYYIFRYGCKLSTIYFLMYRFIRDIYSITFKRW